MKREGKGERGRGRGRGRGEIDREIKKERWRGSVGKEWESDRGNIECGGIEGGGGERDKGIDR